MRHRASIFIVVMALAAVVTGACTYAMTWAAKAKDCRHAAITGAFLAYCQNASFGDYEHVAYALGLEPAAVAAAKRADVLFVGNSTTQFAFSSTATRRFFAENKVRHYLLGFGYGEYSDFFRRLEASLGLRPRMVVVNVDEYFVDGLSVPAKAVVRMKASAWADYLMKWAFVRLAGPSCRILACTISAPLIYRSKADGAWIWQTLLSAPDIAQPITSIGRAPFTDQEARPVETVAGRFFEGLGLKKACIVLTAPPDPNYDNRAIVKRLGETFGLPTVYPDPDGLGTIDGLHLNAASAERWSAEFLRQFAPLMRSCLDDDASKRPLTMTGRPS